LKNPKIPQFHCHVISETIGDMVQGALNDIKDLVLYHAGLVANCHHDVALG